MHINTSIVVAQKKRSFILCRFSRKTGLLLEAKREGFLLVFAKFRGFLENFCVFYRILLEKTCNFMVI